VTFLAFKLPLFKERDEDDTTDCPCDHFEEVPH